MRPLLVQGQRGLGFAQEAFALPFSSFGLTLNALGLPFGLALDELGLSLVPGGQALKGVGPVLLAYP